MAGGFVLTAPKSFVPIGTVDVGGKSLPVTLNDEWRRFLTRQLLQAIASGGGGISELTGDVEAGPGTGSVTAALVSLWSGGSFTNANITVDAKGRVVSAANGTGGSAVFPKGATWDASPQGTVNPVGASVMYPAPCQAAGTILGAYAIGDVSPSSATVEVWKSATGKPTSANKISGTNPISLSAATSSVDTVLAGWSTTAVAAGDRFGFKVLTSTVFSFLGVYLLIG